jgi:hypothetical protein
MDKHTVYVTKGRHTLDVDALIEELPTKSIEDPWYSRPIDIHRTSAHPSIDRMVEIVWEAHFADWEVAGRPGPKPKLSFKSQLTLVLLDLYVAWLEDPKLSIGVAMSANAWDTSSRYNALGISKRIIPIIQRLAEVGLVDLAKGSYSGPWGLGNRTTRIRASAALRELFGGTRVARDDIVRVDTEECIVLKAGEPGKNAKLVDFEDTAETNRMREDLRAYNRLLLNTFIDIPGQEEAFVDRVIDTGPRTGKTTRLHLDHHHHFVRRVFNRERWDLNGRFYGPWWQQIGSDLRQQIFINDKPTVEVDFKGLHVAILSAERGIVVEGDVYALPEGVLPGAPEDLQRKVVKHLVLTALNATSLASAFKSFRDGWPEGTMQKGLTDVQLQRVLDAFLRKHPHLTDALGTDQGIRLMNIDSQIAALVQNHFTALRIAVLSVHDSFIINYERVKELRAVMGDASEAVVGIRIPVAAAAVGLDEFGDDGYPQRRLDFRWWRETARSKGYLGRLESWEARIGRNVGSN